MHNQKTLILVLGMKRSGTSVLTKGLETMGVSLGNHFMPPNEFNKTGYWEDRDFHELNFEMLKSCTSNRARRILPLGEAELDFLLSSPYVTRARELLLKKIPNNQPLALKVPTASLLIPFWKKMCEQLGIALNIIIALRNPISVAISVERSFQDIQEKSFWIWIASLLCSLKYSDGHRRIIVDYDALMKNPAHQMGRIAQVMDLYIDQKGLHEYTDHFIDPLLRHVYQKQEPYSNQELCFQLAIQMYKELLKIAMDQMPWDELKKPFERWLQKFSSIQGLLVILEMHEFTIAKLVDLYLEQKNKQELIV